MLPCTCRCVVTGLQALHNAGYGHTDVRWANIIHFDRAYRLIDLEFACMLNEVPFTPKGQQTVITKFVAHTMHILL